MLNNRFLMALLMWLLSFGMGHASEESKRLAADIPLFDMHMHIYPGLTPGELESRMTRNGVRWGGGVGAINPQIDTAPFQSLLKGHYFPTIGQAELAASFSRGGGGAMTNLENPMIARALASGERLFPQREAFGFGELILNNQTSSASAQFRRQVRVDSPVVRRMFDIASKHGVLVSLHIEPNPTTIQELRVLLKDYPTVPGVVSHCMTVSTGPSEMEALFAEFPQVYCELSSRSQNLIPHRPELQVYGPNFAKRDWVTSIEKL